MKIVEMRPEHWPAVAAIYEAGIATNNATFETAVPAWEAWDAAHRPDLRLVAMEGQTVVGWAAAGGVSERCCYEGVVEHSVYIAPDRQGAGFGLALLEALIQRAERSGVWTIQSGVFPENERSLALHERVGFRRVGTRERLGKLNGQWRDVVLLERRSNDIE